MAADHAQRRMAAILAADVVGYSRLMGEDEDATLFALKAHRMVIDGLIATHHGRVFGSAGDSVIAEFASPVEAVRCATEIQLALDLKNADLPEAGRMRFRIGINFGDVMIDGDNLMGDDVNVAARLESLAPPGGICVSETVHMQVRDRLSLDFLDLGEHKVKNIARPVRAYRVPVASEEPIVSPFRGLDAFDFEHADLFFGRARAIATCGERLEHLAAGGKAFLLIYGMSGSGKSSLVRAGLLPAIMRMGAVPGIALWRRALVRPSEGPDPIASLAVGLLREGALPELAQVMTPTELAELLRNAPERAPALVRLAFGKAAAALGTSPSQTRLLLAVDQMEELFTTQTEPALRQALVRLLAVLAGSGFVWVIGTIRADFFHRCSEIPGFSALKDGLASFELLPPTGPEIAQIIREPARVAGLRFEESADQGRLDDLLQAAAVADPGSLPLLEFVLDALYQAGRERRLLTFSAYRALGGLEGAIALRADEVVDALPPETQDALPAVLRALTTVRLGDEAVTARPALLAELEETPAKAALVNALIAARLMVGDENADLQAVVRMAHEALLSRWPRARDIVNANRQFLETRARVQTDADRWLSDNRNPDLLLPYGKRLAEAEELLAQRPNEVDNRIAEYVEASSSAQRAIAHRQLQAERARIEAEEAARRERLEREADRLAVEEAAKRDRLEREAERRSMEAAAATKLARRTRIAAGIALMFAVGAAAGAVVGFHGRQKATREAERAEQSASLARTAEAQALEARDLALRNQSLTLSFLSQELTAASDTEQAILLALEALPRDATRPNRPYVVEAEAALFRALSKHHDRAVLHHRGPVTYGAFSPDGGRVVTASFDRTARVWDANDGTEIMVLNGHEGVLTSATFSPDGKQIVTAARDGTARMWDAVTGQQEKILGQPGEVHTAIVSPDGMRVFTASEASAPTIWDAHSGTKIANLEGVTWGTSLLGLSADGDLIAAGEGSNTPVRLWNAHDGALVGRLDGQSLQVVDTEFSSNGARLLTLSWNGLPRLWDLAGRAEIVALAVHPGSALQGAFSHDGKLVATVAVDGSARLFNADTGELTRVLGQETGADHSSIGGYHWDRNIDGAFSPDDALFSAASRDGVARIWDVGSGSLVAVLPGHGALARHVAFSPDGRRLLTASDDGTARLWDLDGPLTVSLPHQAVPTFAAFSPDGMRMITGGSESVGYLWDVLGARKLARLEALGSGPFRYATFSPDGTRVAIAFQDGRIVLWDVASGNEAARMEGHKAGVVHLEFSLGGDLLASASLDGTARLWDAASGAELIVLQASGNAGGIFSPDSKLLLTILNDNTAQLWGRDGGKFQTLSGHAGRINAAAFSADGRLVSTGSLDGTARVWSVGDDAAITLKGHAGPVTDVAFSRDGKSLVTASRDGTARIWSAEDGSERIVLSGHKGSVSSAAFSPNGAYVVTASSQDRSVRLWAAASGREIAILAGPENAASAQPALTGAAFHPDGSRVAVFAGGKSVEMIRVFPNFLELIEHSRSVVPRELTECERMRLFLPVEGDVGDCPS